MELLIFLIVALAARQAQAKTVWAHFMVSNTKGYSIANWESEIILARDAKIDGFALNMGWNENTTAEALPNVFKAANNLGNTFKLFFSLDYAGNGAWPQDEVIALINAYQHNGAYFRHNGQPLVSTFEGPANASDWNTIKPATNAFFIPSYSSLGAKEAMKTGVVDGLFSWGAWQEGPHDNHNTVDESYRQFLNGKPYMMPVSPWFFTNMPFFRKNWVWRGDDLWYDRWVSVLALQPEFVQIISWNDYGESHYIGPAPARAAGYEAFDRGLSPFNYALNMPHDGWRLTLPYWIDMYKTGTTSVTREGVSAWYRQAPGLACASGGTTGNTATQLQFTHPPEKILRDKVFFDAVLGSAADVTVTIGGANANAKWENIPDGNVGVYHGSVDFGGRTGAVVVRITRGGTTVVEMTGEPIRATCANAVQNWNPWVGSKQAAGTIDARSPPADSLKHCVDGRGLGFYVDLCNNACRYDYCPPVCTCTALASKPRPHPGWVDVHACPADGFDGSFVGLCSMTCAIKVDYCSPVSCAVKPAGYVCPELDPKDPLIPKCIAGTAGDKWKGLCEFGCAHNVCPPDICMCTEVAWVGPPGPEYDETVTGISLAGKDFGLCDWACKHGECDVSVCQRFPPIQLPSTELGVGSTCVDMQNAGMSHPESSLWNQVGASDVLKEFLDKHTKGDWVSSFASPLGVGQSMSCASLTASCIRLNCDDIGETARKEPGSAAKLLILMSVYNLYAYMKAIREGITASKLQFSSEKASILTDFWKKETPLTAADKQMFNILNTGIGMIAAVGGPVGAPIPILVNGIFTAVQVSIDDGITFTDLAALEKKANVLFNEPVKALDAAYTSFQGIGKYKEATIQRMLADGAFVDYRTIPVINSKQANEDSTKDPTTMNPSELSAFLFAPILGSIINTAWRNANLVLMAYDMTRAEFDNIKLLGDEFGLRYWDPPTDDVSVGTGYFYQQWKVYKKQGFGATDMVNLEWPLGFDKLDRAKNGLGWEDPLVSSIRAYNAGGFDYEPMIVGDVLSPTRRVMNKLDHPGKVPGVFNIPVCDMNGATKNVRDFAELLSGSGGSFGLRPDLTMRSWPGYCECVDATPPSANNVKHFKDVALTKDHWDICKLGKLS